MYEITRIIQEVVNLVKYYFKIDFHEDDVYYFRFITHLKFFAQRLVEQKVYTEDDIEDLWAVIRGKYPKSFDCVERITKFIESKYKYHFRSILFKGLVIKPFSSLFMASIQTNIPIYYNTYHCLDQKTCPTGNQYKAIYKEYHNQRHRERWKNLKD